MSIEEIKKNLDKTNLNEDRVNVPVIKYFWQASPLAGSKNTSLHKFLRKVNCFDQFSDFELYQFAKFLHIRNYSPQEVIFKEGDGGFAFYLLFDGVVDVFASGTLTNSEENFNLVTQLGKYDYFGELALLEEKNKRNATAVSNKTTTLLTIYKPDLEELIEKYPVVGAKFIQSLSTIVAKRFNAIAIELKSIKNKLKKLEENARNE